RQRLRLHLGRHQRSEWKEARRDDVRRREPVAAGVHARRPGPAGHRRRNHARVREAAPGLPPGRHVLHQQGPVRRRRRRVPIPAPRPFASDFDPSAIPRIRSAHMPWHNNQQDYLFDWWITQLERNPSSVYVSDGDATRVSFPPSESGKLSSRYQSEANPITSSTSTSTTATTSP